ncbi:MAG: RagB/SusD family nutrient uptake outer membrane protein [Cyclobacteriaceae bacterium]
MLVLVFGMITACDEDELLDQTNPNALAPTNFWNSAEDAKKGIMGAYAPFNDIWYYSRFEIFLSDYRDDLVNGYAISERTAAGNFNADPASNGARWVWSAMYKGVSRANEVLFWVPSIEMDDAEKDAILGEAYFIRALNYFNLVNYWRNVPLVLVPAGQIEDPRAVPQADPSEVYAQIVSDLQQAQNLLPASWSDEDKGRARNVSATAMLGKAYLYMEEYGLAKAEFDKVIADGSVDLMPDYRDNFREATENNMESLFEVQMKNADDGQGGWCADCANHGAGAAFHQDLTTRPFGGQDGLRINQWALDLFLDEQTVNGEIDPRAWSTLLWDNTTDSTLYQGDYLKTSYYQGQTYDEAWGDSDDRIFVTKHLDFEVGYGSASEGGWHRSGNNLRLLRFADVLLMHAEAEFMLNGSSAAALASVNRVRARVDMPALTAITMQDIMDERVKELSLERTRYYDLLRWGMVKERIVDTPGIKSESGGVAAYRPGREYIGIPTNEMNNSDVFVQNQGWESL